MRTRYHKSYGHGLAPGTDRDINCLHCVHEDESGVTPVITGKDSAVTDRKIIIEIEAPRTGHTREGWLVYDSSGENLEGFIFANQRGTYELNRFFPDKDSYRIVSKLHVQGKSWKEAMTNRLLCPNELRRPVDPELFRNSAPAWNCVDYPGDGMHYVPGTGDCRWCGMTAAEIRSEHEKRAR